MPNKIDTLPDLAPPEKTSVDHLTRPRVLALVMILVTIEIAALHWLVPA